MHKGKLRKHISDQEILGAYQLSGENVTRTAKILSALDRGQISRQLVRHWIRDLSK